nr:histidine kinase dimerization/phosphoacceptor domain -containing protein [uncultured Flavobacterium sp.]
MHKAISLSLLFFFVLKSFGQKPNADTKLQLQKTRLMIQDMGIYIHSVNQGLIDIDSAMTLVCKVNKIPYTLVNDEGYNDGSYFPGNDLITKGNIHGAEKLVFHLELVNQIKLTLQLASFYLFKPGTKKADLNNAFFYITKAEKLAKKTKIQKWYFQTKYLLAKYYYQAGNKALSKTIFAQLTAKGRKTNDTKIIAEAIDNQGTFMPNDNPEKAVILTEAMNLYKKLGFKEKEIETLMKIITVHFWTGNMNLAKQECLRSLALQKKIGFKYTHYTETTIAYLEMINDNAKNALYYALQSINSMEITKDYAFADSFYMRLGNIYYRMGHYEQALKFYEKGISYNPRELSGGTWYKSFFSALDAMTQRRKYSEALRYLETTCKKYPPRNDLDNMILYQIKASCLENLGRMKEAEASYEKMFFYGEKLNTTETIKDVAAHYSYMALFYTKINKTAKAKAITDKVIAITKDNNHGFNPVTLELSLFKIDSISGNYYSAIKHYENYKKIQDSMYSTSKNKEFETLKFKYETVNKEHNIKTLKEQAKQQESKLRTSTLLNTISISSLALLLIIVILLYNRAKIKQRNTIRLELKEKEINLKNVKLQNLVEEKEWLLKEIHHRVKNNLQTILSLLNSQSAYLSDDLAISTIKNSQNRIHAMSLIHQKLYLGEKLSTINMPDYCDELIDYLKDSFNVAQLIRFEKEIVPVELDISQAIPLGLIINEVVTNSIKYAFSDKNNCVIKISLLEIMKDCFVLTISDNGIGIANVSDLKNSNSFGMTLIQGLSDTLDGDLSIENENGLIIKLAFKREFK